MSKTITMKTKPNKIVDEFVKVFNNGDEVNLATPCGFLYAVGGGAGSILCKIENGEHYSFQRDQNKWVGPL